MDDAMVKTIEARQENLRSITIALILVLFVVGIVLIIGAFAIYKGWCCKYDIEAKTQNNFCLRMCCKIGWELPEWQQLDGTPLRKSSKWMKSETRIGHVILRARRKQPKMNENRAKTIRMTVTIATGEGSAVQGQGETKTGRPEKWPRSSSSLRVSSRPRPTRNPLLSIATRAKVRVKVKQKIKEARRKYPGVDPVKEWTLLVSQYQP